MKFLTRQHSLTAGLPAVAVAMCLLAALGGAAVSSASPTAALDAVRPAATVDDPRPNVVLITTDDQTVADLEWMPHTRRLLEAQGVRFENSLSPHPLCCPARALILTGQYAQNNGVRSNRGPMGGFHRLDTDHTIATWLDRAGYKTAFVGKFLNGYGQTEGLLPGWDIFNPTIRGVYRYYDYTMLNNGLPVRYPDTHNADLIGEKTVNYINRFSGSSRPFFIWASQVAPHGTCDPAKELHCWVGPIPATRHADMYGDEEPPSITDPAFNEADVSDKPAAIRGMPLKEEAHVRDVFRDRIRSLQSVDEAVARTVAALRRTGELDNTLIVFTSDNGYLLGEHRFEGKDVPYEEALRTPLLVRGPGVPAGVVRHQTVTTIDLAPTFLAAANTTADIAVDGESILPLLEQDSAESDETVLIQSGPRNDLQLEYGWNYRGVRTNRYTYAQYPSEAFVELYDRSEDPHQLASVAGDPRYVEIEAELARRTGVLGGCSGEICRTQFEPLPEPLPVPAE